ncbi:6030_t:CDS:1, partial [Acaulospora morrowiae]
TRKPSPLHRVQSLSLLQSSQTHPLVNDWVKQQRAPQLVQNELPREQDWTPKNKHMPVNAAFLYPRDVDNKQQRSRTPTREGEYYSRTTRDAGNWEDRDRRSNNDWSEHRKTAYDSEDGQLIDRDRLMPRDNEWDERDKRSLSRSKENDWDHYRQKSTKDQYLHSEKNILRNSRSSEWD